MKGELKVYVVTVADGEHSTEHLVKATSLGKAWQYIAAKHVSVVKATVEQGHRLAKAGVDLEEAQ